MEKQPKIEINNFKKKNKKRVFTIEERIKRNNYWDEKRLKNIREKRRKMRENKSKK